MKPHIKHSFLIVFVLAVAMLLPNCSGINLPGNCEKQLKITYAVLPFYNDDYRCNKNIENKLTDMCYNIVDGEQMLNEYCMQVNKKMDEISIDEFCNYAKQRGVNQLILGEVEIVWVDGMRPKDVSISDAKNIYKASEEDMYNIITGNYARLNCYSIDTDSKDKKSIFTNYNVKKVNLGMPSI